MIMINDERLYQQLCHLPPKLFPILPYYIDVIRRTNDRSVDNVVDELLEGRMETGSSTPGLVLPVENHEPFFSDAEMRLAKRMKNDRDSDLYNDLYLAVTLLNQTNVFDSDRISEINQVLRYGCTLIQFLSPYSFVISRRL